MKFFHVSLPFLSSVGKCGVSDDLGFPDRKNVNASCRTKSPPIKRQEKHFASWLMQFISGQDDRRFGLSINTVELSLHSIDLCTSPTNHLWLFCLLVAKGASYLPSLPVCHSLSRWLQLLTSLASAMCSSVLCRMEEHHVPRMPSVLPDMAIDSSACEEKSSTLTSEPSPPCLSPSESHLGKVRTLSYWENSQRNEISY